GIDVTVAEAQRAVQKGHRGIVMLVEPSQNLEGLKHFNDPYWDPLWATCQDLNAPIHWHAGGGLRLTMPRWSGYTRNQEQAMGPAGGVFGGGAVVFSPLLFRVVGLCPRPWMVSCP